MPRFTVTDALTVTPPETWARFAAAALQALVGKVPSDPQMRGIPNRHQEAADEAAKYADALAVEWARRFLQEVK